MVSGSSRDRIFRIDWWVPVNGDPGEWAGRWRRIRGAAAARDAALDVLRAGAALDLVLIAELSLDGTSMSNSALGVAEIGAWDAEGALPTGARDADVLPPAGRDDVECAAMLACRDALVAASAIGLLHRAVVTAILEIIQQAFAGAGPAVDNAALVAPEVFSAMPGRGR